MFPTAKILKPDVPPRRRRLWFYSLISRLRLSFLPSPNFLPVKNAISEQGSAAKRKALEGTAPRIL